MNSGNGRRRIWQTCNVTGWICLYLTLTGRALSQPVEVLPPDLRGAVQPQVAVAPGGGIFLTFGKENSIYCVASTDDGRTFRRPVEVGRLPKLALRMRRGPRIAAADRQVTISAISHEDGNLYAWASDDAGATWSRPVIINSATNAAREGLHAMTGDGNGTVYAAWLDLRNQGTQLWGAASRDGGKSWTPNVMIYQSPDGHICECCHPSAIMSADGVVRVMWRNWLGGARDMYSSVSTDGGKSFAPAEKLGVGAWPLNACPMDGGSLAGRYTVWRRANSINHTDDRPGEHLLGPGTQPVVGLSRAEPYFVWQDGLRLLVSKGTSVKPAVLAEGGASPVIADGTKNRGPIVFWESATNGAQTILAEVQD